MLQDCRLAILFAVILLLFLPGSSMAAHYLIYGQAQIQYWPQHPTDTPVTAPFANERIEIWDQIQRVTYDYTNANGDYNIDWYMGMKPYYLWSQLTNSYVDICDGLLGNPVSHSHAVSAFDYVEQHNWTYSVGGQENVFYHINRVHNFFKNTLGYNGMDYQMDVHINVSEWIGHLPWVGWGGGAASNGEDIWITEDGEGHKYSDVLYHEYTHNVLDHIYAQDLHDSGLMGRSLAEGLCDYFAATLNGDQRIGEGYISPYRELEPNRYYPADYGSDAHDNGRILGGACWDLRSSLGASTTDALVFNTLFVTPRARTFQQFLDNMLVADDNDGNLENGTPHDAQILANFRLHGIYPSKIYVPGNYSTIQAGINAASSGTTVLISAGTYYESLTMKTGVDLKRSGAGTVTIRPGGPRPIAVFNGVGNILVENINFRAACDHDAVDVINCAGGIRFSSCHFYDSGLLAGVYVSGGTSSVSFEKCSFHGNHEGLKVNNSTPTFNYGEMKNNVYSNTYGVYCTNQGIPYLSPNNNFSWPSTNSSYDIRATSSVTGDIHAEQNYWGEGGREPAVLHDGSGTIITSNPLSTPAKIVVDTRPLAQAQEKLFSGDRSGALADFKAIIAASASQEEALAAVHGVMFASNQTPEEVEVALSYLEGIQSDHKGSEIGAAALYVSISGLVSQGSPGEALSKIDQILRDHPTSPYVPYALLEKAFLLDYTYGDEQGTEEVFAQIAAIYPDWELTPMVKTRLEAWRQARAGLPEEEKSVVSLSCYPNPANPTTTICLQLPRTARVSVLIYNVLGQSVRTLLDDVVLGPGAHAIRWDGRDAAGQELASGIYVCTLKAGKLMRARRIVLLR
ncbi:MAG: hypothetical protein DRQ02_06450 [Candidatus Latescibacterota bacterium]|nr:MAG: hypothetical protein DRQ02_06450 [Candidatus Latescibacterota bacterium]RKY71336.1 MAG: hypothetical protein DRQ24_07595 [Candidatus Latescibacterota bacterium]